MLTQELLNGKYLNSMLWITTLLGFGIIVWWVIDGERKTKKDD